LSPYHLFFIIYNHSGFWQVFAEDFMPEGKHILMYIIMVAPECTPVVKVGGLGDVIQGLSRELEIRGNAVEIILPKYDCMRYDRIHDLQVAHKDLWVPWYSGEVYCDVWSGFVLGKKCFFIDAHSHDLFFNRGVVYGHGDDVMRFAFFCKAALEFMLQSGKHPEIIHCHDWQTALVPVLLYDIYQDRGMTETRVCLTIHNFKHQGPAGLELLTATNLNRPDYYFSYDRLRDNLDPFCLNLLKGGIAYSNFITTVSGKHAWEARFTDQGFGLQQTLYLHQSKFGGILNGIDYDLWNPERDLLIPHRYGIGTIDNKIYNKSALRQRFLLQEADKPVVAFIGRLDEQKGLPLVEHALYYCLKNNTQFVLLGSSPLPEINDYWCGLKQSSEDNPDCHLEIGFDDSLAHLIYAGADLLIMPSLFEPCGLAQMIAMRYGTVPVVRSVGGLSDTVYDLYDSDKPLEERNGFVFHTSDAAGIESALKRAITLWHEDSKQFYDLMKNGMKKDLSWKDPAKDYLNIYNHIRTV